MTDWNLTETFDFEGRRVRFGISGKGPPLIVVHGTPWSSFNMRHLIEAAAKKFTVHFFDLIGYGQSDMSPGDVSLGIQNRVLDRLIDHWGLKEPAVIGHDFGGATVLRTHLINRRNFDRLVLIDPVSLSPWGSPFFEHVKRHEEAFAGVPDYIHEAILRAYIGTAACSPLPREVIDRTVQPWTVEGGKAAFYRQIAQAREAYTDEVEPLYSAIEVPVMILWGAEDTWIPVERGRILHARIPGSRFHVIAQAGHLVIEERPDLLIEKIEPFLFGE